MSSERGRWKTVVNSRKRLTQKTRTLQNRESRAKFFWAMPSHAKCPKGIIGNRYLCHKENKKNNRLRREKTISINCFLCEAVFSMFFSKWQGRVHQKRFSSVKVFPVWGFPATLLWRGWGRSFSRAPANPNRKACSAPIFCFTYSFSGWSLFRT